MSQSAIRLDATRFWDGCERARLDIVQYREARDMCRLVCRLHDGLHGIDSERALEYHGIIQSMPFTFSQEGEHTRG